MKHEELTRFENDEGHFKLTKIGSKRTNSMVGVGQTAIGQFALVTWPATSKTPAQYGVMVVRGLSTYIRTSPVVKIVDSTETTTTFETEGGVYRLEKQQD